MRDYKVIPGNLIRAEADCIVHQVNCMGKMASGVAKAIRDEFPIVYDTYYGYWYMTVHLCNLEYRTNELISRLLGTVQYVPLVTEKRQYKPYICINMFTQGSYGYDGMQYTDMDALKKALESINENCKGMTVAFPWMVGCVRGGGDWGKVLPLILETLTEVKEIKFYKIDP